MSENEISKEEQEVNVALQNFSQTLEQIDTEANNLPKERGLTLTYDRLKQTDGKSSYQLERKQYLAERRTMAITDTELYLQRLLQQMPSHLKAKVIPSIKDTWNKHVKAREFNPEPAEKRDINKSQERMVTLKFKQQVIQKPKQELIAEKVQQPKAKLALNFAYNRKDILTKDDPNDLFRQPIKGDKDYEKE